MSDPIHRDDLPMEVVEQLQSKFQSEFGDDVKLVFLGDMPEGSAPPEILAALNEQKEKMRTALMEGRCLDCGRVMENWPPPDDDAEFEKWQPAPGWMHFNDDDEISAWQCPECDAKESTPCPT